ncbi:MAG TPA: hypothetical protein VFZ75_09950 [Actinomycetota bacterium]|nr:hypothetical protein [Actinomycetota bacterium]
METATRQPRALEPAPQPSTSSPTRRFLAAAAGPALIIGSVLVALRGIAFLPNLTDQHPDILSFWLPRSCLLGEALTDGSVPTWNPHELVGTPFAADPQSGWLYAPTMALSWLFGCGGGLRALVVLNPILTGLGLLWFLRKEGLGRVAATAGGLAIALGISASVVAISLPFSGSLAWTAFVLVGASGFFSSAGWRRIPWLALSAFAWGQVASAHLSHGLVMATALALAYVIARGVREARAGTISVRAILLLSAGFVLFLPLANLAILLPRFSLLARSTLADGYGALQGTLPRAAGAQDRPIPTDGLWAAWPFAFGSAPGGYLGAAMLVCLPIAFRDAARRFLVVAFAAVAVGGYLLTSSLLIGAGWFRSFVLALPFGDVYLHNPGRLRYLLFVIVPVLGAVGVQWLLERRPSFGEAIRPIGLGVGVFLVLPLLLGAHAERFVLLAIGSAALVAIVWAIARGKRWAPVALCVALALELLAGAIWSSMYRGGTVFLGLESLDQRTLVAPPLRWPDVALDEYLEPGPIARTLQAAPNDRYLAWIPPDAYFNKGYLFTRKASDWPALLIGRSVLFGLNDALGYSPIQLPRYWSYVRAINRSPVFYNASVIQVPRLEHLRLLGVRYLIVRDVLRDGRLLPPGLSGRTVETEGAYRLVEIHGSEPRVSVVPDWQVVPDAVAALGAVTADGFDPATAAVLEADPGIDPVDGGAPGTASYSERRPEDVVIRVDAPAPSIVVVRNAWEEGWSATVDGEAAPVLPTDLLLQGVAVPAGVHEVRLVYREPALARGLLGSAIAWLVLLGVVTAVLLVQLRMRRSTAQAPTSVDPP